MGASRVTVVTKNLSHRGSSQSFVFHQELENDRSLSDKSDQSEGHRTIGDGGKTIVYISLQITGFP